MSVKALIIPANGLAQSALEWPAQGTPRGTVVLVHGYMDAAGTWDRVAPALAAAGLRVVAPNVRGFGDGPRVPSGGYYHFSDYVFDLADEVESLSPDEPVMLVGHSMGGVIATLFTGAFPERVSRLALLEGLGPPDNPFEVGPFRMRRWIEGVREVRSRREVEADAFDRDEALERLATKHPRVARETLERVLGHLAHERDGALAWRFDPLHRTTSPVPFFSGLLLEFAKRVTCPVLWLSGGPSGFHPPDEEERLAAFSRLERFEIGGGHMMHWTRADELVRALDAFLR